MSLIALTGVAFELPNGRELFRDIHLSLEYRLYGLVGPNGAGKSTLASLISGAMDPSAGRIHRIGEVYYFKQAEDPPACTIGEYVGRCDSRFAEAILAGIGLDSRCNDLSGGQWMRVRLAKKPTSNFLILDEPTNDLDRAGREALLQLLRARSAGTLLVSHDREALSLCDEILELDSGRLTHFNLDWVSYTNERAAERLRLSANLDVAKRERAAAHKDRNERLSKQEKANRRGRAAKLKGGHPKILLGARERRAEATLGRIDRSTAEAAEKAVSDAATAFRALRAENIMYESLNGAARPTQKLIAEAEGFNIHYDRWLFREDLTFSWRGNIRLALLGPNGSGKSTLLRALTKNLQTRGVLRRGATRTLFVDQQGGGLDPDKTILANAAATAQCSELEVRNTLAKFLFTGSSVHQYIRDLSGGERLRAALAKAFLAEPSPDLLILDEPTNNVDLPNIEYLEQLVRKFRGAVIIVSHDASFLDNCGLTESFDLKG